jgi:hypothetical protein
LGESVLLHHDADPFVISDPIERVGELEDALLG